MANFIGKASSKPAVMALDFSTERPEKHSTDVLPVGDDKPNMGELMKSEDDLGQQTEGALSVLRQTVKDNPHKLSAAHLDVLRARIVKLESKLAKLRARDASPFERDTDKGAVAIVKREKAAGMLAHDIAKKYGFSLGFVNETLGKKKASDVKPV